MFGSTYDLVFLNRALGSRGRGRGRGSLYLVLSKSFPHMTHCITMPFQQTIIQQMIGKLCSVLFGNVARKAGNDLLECDHLEEGD